MVLRGMSRIRYAGILMALLGLSFILSSRSVSAAEVTIQAEDILSINVSGEPALSKNYTVDTQGDINMETIGKVPVAGLTPLQAEGKLTEKLKKFYKLFKVHVAIAADNTGSVLVFGEVTKPGAVKLGTNMKLLDVLAEAGQPTPNADIKKISILRKAGGDPEIVDLEAVLKDKSLNVPMRPGDTITIVRKEEQTILIDGEVRTTGPKPLENARTAYAAIVSAGPTENADWTRIVIRHKDTSLPMIVDLSKVRTGEMKDDLLLQPGDQVTVTSKFLGSAILSGEVKTPGEKPINGKTQLMDFIETSGGGFTDNADITYVQILREGQEPRIFNLEEVRNGTKSSLDPEMAIRPGDKVFVRDNKSMKFAIAGGVKKSGSYPASPGMRLMDAIMAAEGPTPDATKKQFVIAPLDPNDERIKANAALVGKNRKVKKDVDAAVQQSLIVVEVSKFMDGSQNIPIKPGDRILIPTEQPNVRGSGGFLGKVLGLLPFASLFR